MPEIQYPTNPNSDTAFVVQEDGTKNRALMTAPQDTSTLELPSNSNSTKGYVTVDGKKQRVILTADIGGGGGGGSVDYAKTVQRAETMPTAAASNAGQQFLYSGESDATYTHGYIYENVASTTPASATGTQTTGSTLSDITVDGETFWEELEEYDIPQQTGDYVFTYNGGTGYWDYGDDYFDLSDFGVTYTGTPTDGDVLTISVTAPSATYAWTRVDVQPAPEALPDQTGQSGKFLTTDGTDASWSDKPLVNTATGTDSVSILSVASGQNSVAIGHNISAGRNSVSIGNSGTPSQNNGAYAIAIGTNASTTGSTSLSPRIAIGNSVTSAASKAIQLGFEGTNSDANTFKVANGNGNFEIMSADGTIPEARLADTTSAQQGDVLTLDGNGNAVWQAGASGTSSITVTLAAADWSGSSQTVTATGVTASNTVLIGAAPASASEYNTCGVICTAQGADSLTFTCTSTPTNDLTVNVIIL